MAGPWRCVLLGTEPLLIECAAMLTARGHALAAIVSTTPAVREWAASRGIALLNAATDLLDAELGAIDHLFSITNLDILPSSVTTLPTGLAINFHDGPLPDYAGLNTPAWAVMNGEAEHGVTWHLMDSGVDTGAILLSRRFATNPEDTAYTLNTKCFAAAIETFEQLLDGMEAGTLASRTQPHAPVRYYGRGHRPALAGTIGWDLAAETIARQVRALDFGGRANPIGAAKLLIDGRLLAVSATEILPGRSGAPAGTVIRVDGERIVVATATEDVALTGLTTLAGGIVSAADAAKCGLVAGATLDRPTDQGCAIEQLDRAAARFEPWWRDRLVARDPLALSLPRRSDTTTAALDQSLPPGSTDRFALAAAAAFLGRITGRDRFDVGYTDPVFASRFAGVEPWFAAELPLQVALDFGAGLDVLAEALGEEVRQLHRRVGHTADLAIRSPGVDPTGLPLALLLVDCLDEAAARPQAELTIAIQADGTCCRWLPGPHGVDAAVLASLQRGFAALLAAALAEPARPLASLPLAAPADIAVITGTWNATAAPWRSELCVHEMFAEQAQRTPDAPAVTSRGTTLSYADLHARSTRLARHLRQFGVGRGTLVGLHVARSVEMLVALIAIHKAGGAYVPLDPAYPAERIAHMIADSAAPVVVTQAALADRLPHGGAALVRIDADWPTVALQSDEPLAVSATTDDLAYVIYTSGSTGQPKGVMVEHRNVANFFAGMDRVVEPGGTWLAVTSLSFDISVLELCWTVANGRHVVIATGEEMAGMPAAPRRPIDFSLFYFASADSGPATDRYRLLLDGARFADTHGFAAVWTPERHFHAFGGLYPNPSVTGAAVAAVTSRVAIRGGSVVLPLHHPARVAEEWSLVDNLSDGRVGIAFASGWQPNDFVLRPDSFADKQAALMKGIDVVRGLWRGESRAFPGPLGTPVEVKVYPRPVQKELPFWITSAGNPDTFAAAGRAGANVLTHLLGQTVEELADKLAVYRRARREAGHSGEGQVTLMLHCFIGEDEDAVRAAVRQPLMDYLRTSTNLVKDYAWSFPAFRRRPDQESSAALDLSSLSDAEMEALLDHAFNRYFETGGLFGTPEKCLAMVDRVRAAGVDEIGCLIDFGVATDAVLAHLPALDVLRRLANDEQPDETLAGLMRQHRVTHLQCTPSMAQMLCADPAAREGLRDLRHLMVGGESFPAPLAAELRALVAGKVTNMYGPTETTIWSAVHPIDGAAGPVPLGRPLANQQVYICDRHGALLPPGMPGELVIGGHGVTRGYWHRPELTADRFVADPVNSTARAYRTGDLARQRDDGTLEFLGRLDHQVKIRGHRVELGEIEAVLGRHAGVERAVVAAREDVPGDVRLVAYYRPASGAAAAPAELRDHLAAYLPAFMVPGHLIALADFPQTPNGKVDRARLPRPDGMTLVAANPSFVAPADGMQERIAAQWRDLLKLPQVGTRDNFFDLGGHSLLAVQLHRRLIEALDRPLPLTAVFRFPTIEALAAHLVGERGEDASVHSGAARAVGRKAALQRRLGARATVDA